MVHMTARDRARIERRLAMKNESGHQGRDDVTLMWCGRAMTILGLFLGIYWAVNSGADSPIEAWFAGCATVVGYILGWVMPKVDIELTAKGQATENSAQ